MWIKVCGITDLSIARQLAVAGVDAIGLNFYAKSPRCVSLETARAIVRTLPDTVEPIGLFVNHKVEQVWETCDALGLKTIQLHGDEPPEFLELLGDVRIIRAFRVGEAGLDDVAQQLDRYRILGIKLRACLVDAKLEGAYGGTGHVAPWKLLADEWDAARWPPLILAGGLNPENVRQAIDVVHPWGVDVASGVEESPGRQSLEKVTRFVAGATTVRG